MAIPTEKLLQFIEAGKTCNEICYAFSITPQQLFQKLIDLQNENMFFERQYYSNGSIFYKPIQTLKKTDTYEKMHDHILITEKKSTDLKCLVFSDLHIGNSKERLDLVDCLHNYCIQNDIHIAFCCGDIIDGIFSLSKQNTKNVYKQIETFLKHYPFDPSVLTFAVAGNHELQALKEEKIDFVDIIKNCRHDIVLSSYGVARINIKNDRILLYHHIAETNPYCRSSLLLHGHAHKYKIDKKSNFLNILVPSLSAINESLPSVLEVIFHFDCGNIVCITIKQLMLGRKNYILSEIECDAFKRRPKFSTIKYEEEFRPEVLETIEEYEKKLVLKKR